MLRCWGFFFALGKLEINKKALHCINTDVLIWPDCPKTALNHHRIMTNSVVNGIIMS